VSNFAVKRSQVKVMVGPNMPQNALFGLVSTIFRALVVTCRWSHNHHLASSLSEVTGRQHLRSATQRKLVVPRYRLNSFGRRRLLVAGPSTWNSLPDSLRDSELSLDTFKRQLKTYIFAKY